ncbi:MAG: DegV family EDD domain-containing protein [Verrucomicrobia bacterium]|nr:DegV family EDD domain-containing protein [Verrucomicrobiota bacterium]
MSPRPVSPTGLRAALRAGCLRVIAERAELNHINIFPVPDGDTGTNLALTVGAIWHGLRGPAGPAAVAVLRRAAAEANDHARGNSGALFAHFLQGAVDALPPAAPLAIPQLAAAAAGGAARARAALARPREGTILSVMQAFADALAEGARAAPVEPRAGFLAAVAAAQGALRRTTTQVPELRRAGLVDAGARGFVNFLEGAAQLVETGRAALRGERPVDVPPAAIEAVAAGENRDGSHCVECTIRADPVDRAGLKAALLQLPLAGFVIEGTRQRARVHAHAAHGDALLAAAARYGAISQVRSERAPAAGARSRRVAIVTDSGADVPDDIHATHDLHVVPVRLSLGGRDCIDGVSLSPREFYDAMRTSEVVARTSQPPPGDFRRMYEHLLAHHDEVIEVSVAGNLSGALQSAGSAAARTDPRRVRVFDSGHVAGALGLMALWAAEAAQAGWTSAQILAGLERMRPRSGQFGLIRDVRYGVRGGRVPRLALPLTRLLRVCPLARNRPDGRFGMLGGMWGRSELAERFARRVARQLDPSRTYRLIVGHCDCAGEADRVRTALVAAVPRIERIWVMDAGTAIGAHAGPGSLLIGYQDYEPPAP